MRIYLFLTSAVLLIIAVFGINNACSELSLFPWQAKPQYPNVLFIKVDDMNDWVGCLGGHPHALTPNIDKLASRGVLFTNAHTTAPVCNPSRVALLSGMAPYTTGVYQNRDP